MTDSFIREDDWEFNAPRFCDFNRMGMNMSRTDQWFETSEAAQLENIEAEILRKRSREQKQRHQNSSRIKSPMFTPIRTPRKNQKKSTTNTTTATATAAIPFKNNPAATRLKLTIPRTPKFRTTHRIRSTTVTDENMDHDFASHQQQKQQQKQQQQKHKNIPKRQQQWEPKLTQPVPFRLHESTKSNNDALQTRSPFKSNLERIKEFDKNCRNSQKQLQQTNSFKPTITIPKEFHLSTSTRRTNHVLSTEERERLEIENAPKFKARPLNPKLFQNSGSGGVQRVEKKQLTRPEGFKLHTELRAGNKTMTATSSVGAANKGKKRTRVESEEEEEKMKKPSKVQKMNDGSRSQPKLTVPESPCLATKMRHRPVVVPEPEPIPAFKARPMPDVVPFKPKLGELPLTEPEPFPLKTEIRGQMHVETWKEKMEREMREMEQKRIFKAKPVNINVNHGLTKVEKMPLTEPEPFNLAGEVIHLVAQERIHERVREEEQKIKAAARSFKARPMPEDKPFVPQKPNIPLTEPIDAPLKSELRAEERRRFDSALRQKEMEMEAERKRMEEEKRKQEELELMQLRREMEVKARPMPVFYNRAATSAPVSTKTIKKPLSIHEKREKRRQQKAVAPPVEPYQPKLTIPQEFRFQTSERSKMRSMMNH